jgi:putative transposase
VQFYRTTSHTRYDIKPQFVWITKYRRPILTEEVPVRVRELVREICLANEAQILKGHISRDHVYLYGSVPPSLSASKLVQYIKGKTSRKVLMEFPHIRKRYWGGTIWSRGYFVASSGNVTDEVIMEYIESQEKEPRRGDEFKIST